MPLAITLPAPQAYLVMRGIQNVVNFNFNNHPFFKTCPLCIHVSAKPLPDNWPDLFWTSREAKKTAVALWRRAIINNHGYCPIKRGYIIGCVALANVSTNDYNPSPSMWAKRVSPYSHILLLNPRYFLNPPQIKGYPRPYNVPNKIFSDKDAAIISHQYRTLTELRLTPSNKKTARPTNADRLDAAWAKQQAIRSATPPGTNGTLAPKADRLFLSSRPGRRVGKPCTSHAQAPSNNTSSSRRRRSQETPPTRRRRTSRSARKRSTKTR